MHIQVEPGAVFVFVWGAIEKHDLALIPALVGLPDVRQVEGRCPIWRIWRHAGHSSLIPLAAVGRVTLVPDVDRDLLTLKNNQASLDT